jgi:hypothetical protein
LHPGRIDNLVARYPPKKVVESKQQSVLDSLSAVEVDEFKLFFSFFDSDGDRAELNLAIEC